MPSTTTTIALGNVKPVINRDSTAYGAEGYWYDVDKVRFVTSMPQSFGGWQKKSSSFVSGACRFIDTWKTLINQNLTALGTDTHLYIEYGGYFNDITPIDVSASLTNVLNTSVGSTTVVVSVSSHLRQVGDNIIVVSQGVTAGGSILLSGEYPVIEVIGVNSFTINASTTATATSTASGGSLNYMFPLPVGNQSNESFLGYSRGGYSEGGYSSPLSTTTTSYKDIRVWSGGAWGEDYLFSPSFGGLYIWDATSGVDSRAFLTSTSPTNIGIARVDQASRRVIAYGVNDAATSIFNPMLVRWSDQENYTDWAASAGNSAGDFVLSLGSRIVCTAESRSEKLIWTDKALYSQKDIGAPDIYTFDLLGEGCASLGPLATREHNGVVYWMGNGTFWKYDGSLSILPCTFSKDIFDLDGEYTLDFSQREKTYCGVNSRFNEIIWFYQSVLSQTGDCDRYVIYNYKLDTMYYGSLPRTCWLDTGINENPLAVGVDGYLYNHELGLNENTDPFECFIKTGDFALGDGDTFMFVDRIIPDCLLTNELNITANFKNYPNDTTVAMSKTFKLTNNDKRRFDLRGRGRTMNLNFSSSIGSSTWKLGNFKIRAQPHGKS